MPVLFWIVAVGLFLAGLTEMTYDALKKPVPTFRRNYRND